MTVVCPSNERPLPESVEVVETLRPGGMKLPMRLIGGNRVFDWNDRRAATRLRRGAGEFDLVHCWPRGSRRTLEAARRMGVTSVLERPNSHTAAFGESVEAAYRELGMTFSPETGARLDRTIAAEEREYELADFLLCPSEYVVKTFLDRGYDPRRLLLTGRGYDPLQFNTTGRSGSTGPLTACFVGSGEPRKGLHFALRAWHGSGVAAAGGKFYIAGRMEPAYLEALKPLVEDDSVELLGYLSDPSHLLRQCDVLILPSVDEASAKVTYEGRACGCVLVVSDRSSGPTRHGIDAMVHRTGDVEELTNHLRTLSGDRDLLERIRRESVAAAKSMTWAEAGVTLLGAYKHALGRD